MYRIEREQQHIATELTAAEGMLRRVMEELDDDYEAAAYGQSSMARMGNIYGKGVSGDKVYAAVAKLNGELTTERKQMLRACLNRINRLRDTKHWYARFVESLTPAERMIYDQYRITPSKQLCADLLAKHGTAMQPIDLTRHWDYILCSSRDVWLRDALPIDPRPKQERIKQNDRERQTSKKRV